MPCLLVLGLLAACGPDGAFHDARQEPPSSPTSAVATPVGDPIRGAPVQSPAELFYGEGDCAPKLPGGLRGTCINNRPCNGFGMRNAAGEIICACYSVIGGCDSSQACSKRRRACVPLLNADDKRLPAQ